MIRSIIRVFGFAVQNFFRNGWLSLATLTVIIITLLLVNVIVSMEYVKSSLMYAIQERIDISIDFKQQIPEASVLTVKQDLEKDSRVRSIIIVTPEENLERFKMRHSEIGEKVLPLLEKNPLGYTLKIQANQLEDYDGLLTAIESNQEHEGQLEAARLNDLRLFTARAATISEKINFAAMILAGIFFVIALIIVFNTIRVGIYAHREEISIMRLVGASSWFVKMPFLIESVMFAAIATGVVLLTYPVLLNFLQPSLDAFMADLAPINIYSYYASNGVLIFALEFAIVALFNFTSTQIALRRYLRA